jgi:5-methylcytosine-specific restriction endonuclease McrA
MRDPRTNIVWSTSRLAIREFMDGYMVSPEWHERRERWVGEFYEVYGIAPICEVCGELWTLENDNLHHLTYDRRGQEAFEDLVSLCRPDHLALHVMLDGDSRWLRYTRANASRMIIARLRENESAQ